jgi:glycosyltransferase involved in cell wall biosynthesis
LHELFPEAQFYTSYYDQEKAGWAYKLKIKTSFIQKLPSLIRKSRLLSFFLYPLAFESFNLSEYDTVISVTSAFAKGVITKPQTKHICILLTPPRYIWGDTAAYTQKNIITRLGKKIFGTYLQKWDFIAAQRVDTFISISKLVAERCLTSYKRESTVIYPPFDLEYWRSIKKSMSVAVPNLPPPPYHLVVSRLEPYKRVDVVIETFNTIKEKRLVIVGTGTMEEKLKTMASSNITFLKNVSDEDLATIYTNADALIMPQVEDFGYVSLEAQFFGCPVVSFKKSGAAETILEGRTGLFFEEQTTEALAKKLHEFDIISHKLKENCLQQGLKHLETFSKEKFKKELSIYKF